MICLRFSILLVCIAILSAYSIHLLLKSAGVVGKSVHFSHVADHMRLIKPLCYFRHPSLRAARESGFRSRWKNAGCLHHYTTQHWRYGCTFCSWHTSQRCWNCFLMAAFTLQPCPATFSSSSPSCRWLFKLSSANTTTPGEVQGPDAAV